MTKKSDAAEAEAEEAADQAKADQAKADQAKADQAKAEKEPEAVEARNRAFVRLARDFMGNIPEAGRGGGYTRVESDRFGAKLPVPDGRYRIVGTEWVFAFKGGVLAEANVATKANQYGGPDVISIENA